MGVDSGGANLQAAETAAKRALALAPRLPEAHMAMGDVKRFVHHDLAAARDELQQAVNLSTNDSDFLQHFAITDWLLGNLDAAITRLTTIVRECCTDRV